MIRWRKKDWKLLNSTLRKFNNKIRRLQKNGYDSLPKEVSYQDIKTGIYTRNEFNRVIASYSSFLKSGSENIIKLNENENITKWEYSFLKKQQKQALKGLNEKLNILTDTLGTGNQTKNEVISTIESIENYKTKTGSELQRLKERIINLGNTDIEYKKANVFQKNFIKAYSKMKRWEIVRKAREFKDPLEFWNWIKESGLTDIQLRYDVEEHRIKLNMDNDDSYFYELFKLGLFS